MSNKQNPKRISSVHGSMSSKKNKISQPLTSLNDSFGEFSNTTMHRTEVTDGELNDSEKTISSEDLEDEHNISHTNKTVNPEWFKSYSWLGVENLNEET